MKVVRVQLIDCPDVEPLTSFKIVLDTPSNSTIARSSTLVSIVNNGTPVATPKLFVRDAAVDEKDGFVQVPVLLGGPLGQISQSNVVTVPYTTSDRTAHAGSAHAGDYTGVSGTLSFAPGQTVKNVVVPIVDTHGKPPRNFVVTLGTPADATIADGTGTIVIGSSALAPVVQPAISAPPDIVTSERDGYVDLPVSLSAPGQNAASGHLRDLERHRDFGNLVQHGRLRRDPSRRNAELRSGRDDEGRARAAPRLPRRGGSRLVPVHAEQLRERDDREGDTLVSIVNNASVVSKPRLFARDAVVDEKDGTVLVPVLLGGPAGQIQNTDAVTVDYATADGTAHRGRRLRRDARHAQLRAPARR